MPQTYEEQAATIAALQREVASRDEIIETIQRGRDMQRQEQDERRRRDAFDLVERAQHNGFIPFINSLDDLFAQVQRVSAFLRDGEVKQQAEAEPDVKVNPRQDTYSSGSGELSALTPGPTTVQWGAPLFINQRCIARIDATPYLPTATVLSCELPQGHVTDKTPHRAVLQPPNSFRANSDLVWSTAIAGQTTVWLEPASWWTAALKAIADAVGKSDKAIADAVGKSDKAQSNG